MAAASASQAAAILSLAVLAMALLHNYILFSFLDLTLITAFTISDHIASAIELLPLAAGMGLFLLFWPGPIRPTSTTEGRAWLFGLPIGGLAFWILASIIGWPPNAGIVFAFSLGMAWVIGGDYLLRGGLQKVGRLEQFLIRFIGMLIAMVLYFAVSNGINLRQPLATHTLTLADKSTRPVHLIQILERGVVALSVPGGTPMFLAKDEVKRIEKARR